MDLNSGWNWDATKNGWPSSSPISILLPPSDFPVNLQPASSIIPMYSGLTSYLCLWRSDISVQP